jgi:hypothetical protein
MGYLQLKPRKAWLAPLSLAASARQSVDKSDAK